MGAKEALTAKGAKNAKEGSTAWGKQQQQPRNSKGHRKAAIQQKWIKVPREEEGSEMALDWVIDRRVGLGGVCRHAGFHLKTVIGDLQREGFSQPDAEAFAKFIFADYAQKQGKPARQCLTEAQWKRLSATV